MTRQAPGAAAGSPGRSAANRSLERGIEILRAFRPGSDLLGNGELAERTGLSRSTVSRLTQTLVGTGMLQQEPLRKGYRLAPAVLSLANAMSAGSLVLRVAAPRMRAVAQQHRVNVGIAAADRCEMVYLESIRYARRAAFRTIVAGQRVPIELTSLGLAYLAGVPEPQRKALLAQIRGRRRDQWAAVSSSIAEAIDSVSTKGYCVAAWQPEVVAIATPLTVSGATYAMNFSLQTTRSTGEIGSELSGHLLRLKADVLRAAGG
jgi:DNA-binding IclR family transcriptional regulator